MGKYRAPLANSDVIHLIEQNKEPEQKLWIAVLAKAFDDAFYTTDQRAALEALSWIRHGSDFNRVCQRIKQGVDNVIKLKIKKRGPVPGTQKRVYDYKWLPKQTHDYVDR